MGPRKDYNFLKNSSYHSTLISVIYGRHLPKYNCSGGFFRKITVRPLAAQTIIWESTCAIPLQNLLSS
jgi:hypothetical protein